MKHTRTSITLAASVLVAGAAVASFSSSASPYSASNLEIRQGTKIAGYTKPHSSFEGRLHVVWQGGANDEFVLDQMKDVKGYGRTKPISDFINAMITRETPVTCVATDFTRERRHPNAARYVIARCQLGGKDLGELIRDAKVFSL
jgi:hypothetical protein